MRILTDVDVQVLALEREWAMKVGRPGAKEQAASDRLGLSPTRYYQVLNGLLDDEAAIAHDPVTVNRLRRLRDARRKAPSYRPATPLAG